jgi:hypothetical protein
MFGAPDVVLIPEFQEWHASFPSHSKKARVRIIDNLRSINWNRDVVWTEAGGVRFGRDFAKIEGTLESTEVGKKLESMELFRPECGPSREEVHSLYIDLERRIAELTTGIVKINVSGFHSDSVFARVTLPTLANNENVSLVSVEILNDKEWQFPIQKGTDLLAFFRATCIDFDIPCNKIFWSGGGGTNRLRAEALMRREGGVTLNALIAEQDPELLRMIDGIPEAEFHRTRSIWEYLSIKFAST